MAEAEVDELLRLAADAPSPRRRLDYLDAADRLLARADADSRSIVSALLRTRALRALGRLTKPRISWTRSPSRSAAWTSRWMST